MNRIKNLFILPILISLLFQVNIIPVHAGVSDVKNILVLQSYHKGHEWSDREGDAILDTFEESDMKVSVFTEQMDWKRYPDEENLQQLHSRFEYKYSNVKIDLIMATDDAALKFALENRTELFSDAPIVFCGVFKQDADAMLNGYENVTGVYQVIDPAGTLTLAKKMIPELKKIYVIHDMSESGVSTGTIIKNAARTESELEVTDLSEYSLGQILIVVNSLKKDSAVILASYNSDVNHMFLTAQEFAGRISENSSVPVFTIDETILGSGAIGGCLTSGKIHGRVAAEMGLQILGGKEADQIAIDDTKSVFWGFDYSQLARFDISSEILPEDSKIVNKPFSFYETYKAFVLSNIAIIVLLILYILFLLVNLKYRGKTEVTLRTQKEKIFQLAYYSSVTGLPNRINLKERLEQLIIHDKEKTNCFALVYIDIDNFKEVNDTLGHIVGDQILYSFAQRLKEIEEVGNNVYSLGGDEFIVLIKYEDKSLVKEIVESIFDNIDDPFCIEENMFYITVSGGIVYYPEHGDNHTELLKNADTAMYRSKELGKGAFSFFDQSMSDEAMMKTTMQSNLRLAIERGDFILYYQPQLEAKTGEIWGYEALIRWNSPELGFIQPLTFIRIAEDSHLIIPIGDWVLETACAFIKGVQNDYDSGFIVSVNISVIQLLQEDFVEKVLKILDKTGLEPEFLELEITETVFLNHSHHAIEKLEQLKTAGIRVALDDFGTGYSSLSYLSQLPITTLKIDKTFVNSFFESQKDMVLTSTIIKMGHALGMELVVEGVETDEQQELFTKMGCDRIQGYNVGKPVPDKEVFRYLKEYDDGKKLS